MFNWYKKYKLNKLKEQLKLYEGSPTLTYYVYETKYYNNHKTCFFIGMHNESDSLEIEFDADNIEEVTISQDNECEKTIRNLEIGCNWDEILYQYGFMDMSLSENYPLYISYRKEFNKPKTIKEALDIIAEFCKVYDSYMKMRLKNTKGIKYGGCKYCILPNDYSANSNHYRNWIIGSDIVFTTNGDCIKNRFLGKVEK